MTSSAKRTGTRVCSPTTGCGQTKALAAFPDTPTRANGARICRDCQLARVAAYEAKRRRTTVLPVPAPPLPVARTERRPRAPRAASYRYDPVAAWGYRLKAQYSLTVAGYYDLLVDQDYRCAICAVPDDQAPRPVAHENGFARPALLVDQDRATGAIRGLLCSRCLQMIDSFTADPALLTAASSYLGRTVNLQTCEQDPHDCAACFAFGTWLIVLDAHGTPTDRSWKRTVARKYRISVRTLFHLDRDQGSACAICRTPAADLAPVAARRTHGEGARMTNLLIDADPASGAVRGLLCSGCLTGLGRGHASGEVLAGAARYLAVSLPPRNVVQAT